MSAEAVGPEHVASDMDKGTTLGDADGPPRFIPQFGFEVPTFINPREDLIGSRAGKRYKRVDYHIPYKLRAYFKPEDWPQEYQDRVSGGLHVAADGYVLCHGTNQQGVQCSSRAVNRTMFCRNHGGALHPADKKISGSTIVPQGAMDMSRIDKLDRVQKFMQGIITPDELDDDEVKGQFIRASDGHPVRTVKLGAKFSAMLRKELHDRLNQFLLHATPDMLQVIVDIAKNDMYEAADRIKAAQWVSERTMGKVPDVLVTSTSSAPFVSILDSLESGSREDYRQSIESSRVGVGEEGAAYEIIDAEIEPDDDEPEDLPDHEGSVEDCQAVGGEVAEDEGVLVHARNVQSTREEKLAQAKRLRKAKQRRYAARAVGATSLTAIPWLVEFVPVTEDGEVVRHKLKMYPPDRQTPGLVDRLRTAAMRQDSDERNHDGESNG